MIFEKGSRKKLIVTTTTNFDPAGGTLEVEVAGTWYPATWTGAAVAARGSWTRTGETDKFFVGPDQTGPLADNEVKLPPGRTLTRTRVTVGGEAIVAYSSPIDVR